MDPHDATRPIDNRNVFYRCSCGTESLLDPTIGGPCSNCEKVITPKVLGHELAVTMTIHEGSFQLDQTTHPRQSLPGSLTVDVDQQATLSTPEIYIQDPDVLIGEKYGHFEIVATLGRGGMGQVYRALDTSLHRYVAVKLLRSGIVGTRKEDSKGNSKSSDEEIDKLMQEAVSQARVTHPNIVTIYYVGKQDGDPFLAMELVNGKPLNARIEEGEMPFEEISQIGQQIADALQFSLELDIIHGDIKPSNVLLQHHGGAKLSDFGMARRVSKNTDESIGGTPNYIAPELLRGEKPSVQSDIYALGVTLYEMSFGHLPVKLTGKSVPHWLNIHDANTISFPTPWPARFPESWGNLLKRMLSKDPAARHGSYEELIADLKKNSPGSQVVARVFPRLTAAAIDWSSVMILAASLRVGFDINSWEKLFADHPAKIALVVVAQLLPIIIYMLVVYLWRHSLGRNLMHIRVVNRYGMPPNRYQMVLRGFLRMQFPFFAICMLMLRNPTSLMGISFQVMVIVSSVLLLLDVAFLFFYRQHRSLHDLALETRVVLDTGNSG